jgi:hypothetical protein
MTTNFLRKRLDSVMVREVDPEVLLLDTEADQIHQLNQTASFIWRRCEEVGSAEELAALVAAQFDVGQDLILKDVIETLDKLRALNLIVEA